MELRAYFDRPTQSALAEALGVSVSLMSRWCTGARQVPAEQCQRIQDATGGAVRKSDLRPDLWPPT